MEVTAPSPKRNRSAWYLNISKCEGSSALTIIYKNTKGHIAPFSKKNKIPWGTPNKCEYVLTKDKDCGGTYGEFKFTTKRRETEKFREDGLNSFEDGVSNFSKKITSMIVLKQQKLLSMYLTLLPHSVGFEHHREGLHHDEGILVDNGEDNLSIDDLVNNGGSIDE